MENFTPYSAIFGGMLIGLGASLMLLFNGRIMGTSGILSGLISPSKGDWLWRVLFVVGMIAGATFFLIIFPESTPSRHDFPVSLLIPAGLLVGFGTRLGNGCTSGHGVCGIARFSIRSIYATLTFIVSGMLTVFVIRHLIGIAS
ncbi:MAG: YeeE/YedE family protein [Methylococcales bacterium]|nr:YeeE/YedE family protein [Methylococcales bacterium]MCK5924265.1 YeeE/YedE family protein [Methylococcales bacterium]